MASNRSLKIVDAAKLKMDAAQKYLFILDFDLEVVQPH